MLSLYIQCIYQGYTIIYFRICKFIQWIYFAVPIHTVYIPGITIIYFRICKFIQWIYFVVPIHTVHTMDIPFLTPRRSSTYDKPRYRLLPIDCLPGPWPSEGIFHVSRTAVINGTSATTSVAGS